MSDVKRPYCGEEQEINHDDGYGYDESEDYEQQCLHCEKYFNFTTSITFSYEVYCDEGDHDMEHSGYKNLWECANCDYKEIRTNNDKQNS